jgi:hypothetical protein
MTLRHRDTAPGFAVHVYLAAKAALATGGEPQTGCRCKTIRAPASLPAGKTIAINADGAHGRMGRAGSAARQDPGGGVPPAGGPQAAVRGLD